MEQLEEYPSTEQVTAVISSQNDDSQPDKSPVDGSTDGEPVSLVKNDAVPLVAVNASVSEQEKALDKTLRAKSRVPSSQNVVPTTTNSVTTSSLNYTLPELSDDVENRRTNAVTNDNSVDVITSGISDVKLSPTQVE